MSSLISTIPSLFRHPASLRHPIRPPDTPFFRTYTHCPTSTSPATLLPPHHPSSILVILLTLLVSAAGVAEVLNHPDGPGVQLVEVVAVFLGEAAAGVVVNALQAVQQHPG